MNRARFLDRIAARMADVGIRSERALSLRAGLSADFIRNLRRGEVRSPTVENIQKVAHVLGVSAAWLMGEADGEVRLAQAAAGEAVRVVGEVRAGHFRLAFEDPPGEQPIEWLGPDARFPGLARFALRVRGDSLNQIAPPGALVICVRFADLDRAPRDGDLVVAQRWRHDLVEATVKALAVKPDGVWLEPRSTNKAHKPVRLARSIEALDNGEIEIDGDKIELHALVTAIHILVEA